MLGHFCVPKMKQVAYFTGLCSQQIINLTPHQQIINLMLNHLIWCSWSPQTCSFVPDLLLCGDAQKGQAVIFSGLPQIFLHLLTPSGGNK